MKHIWKIEEFSKVRRILPDGRIREYGKFRPSGKPGLTVGQRSVKEIDPVTGETIRVWMENYNDSGEVRIVHPYKPDDLGHLRVDPSTGKVIERWL
ncbi:MAG: hypothetical protein BWK80_52935 [Desulfobacteraceae bacterium IS3]|nr:MAG: hypothetical protein BWK80_52935 [Desulfobacteraceae bacterium IS3]